MLLNTIIKSFRLTLATVVAGLTISGCSSFVYDDLSECPAQLNVKFQFNYTLDRGEAFAAQVHSVNVWAFDQAGKCVWTGQAAGERLANPDFQLETSLGEGVYDFVAWCGLDGNDDFSLATYTPSSMQELDVKLKTLLTDGRNISSSHFKSLFHGVKSGVEHIIDEYKPTITTVTIPLIKDTNDIAVMLVNADGTTLNSDDFSVTFTYADSWLAWDNAVMPDSPTVTYSPWSELYGETSTNSLVAAAAAAADDDDSDDPKRSTLLYEMSTSRLMAGGNAYLDIVRNTDGKRIIHVPLIEYFLLEKGSRFDFYGDQEYLDRRSDYSALFFIDNDLGWYMAGGIYINGWALVPPQSGPLN